MVMSITEEALERLAVQNATLRIEQQFNQWLEENNERPLDDAWREDAQAALVRICKNVLPKPTCELADKGPGLYGERRYDLTIRYQ